MVLFEIIVNLQYILFVEYLKSFESENCQENLCQEINCKAASKGKGNFVIDRFDHLDNI